MFESKEESVCLKCGGRLVTHIVGCWVDVHCYDCGTGSDNLVGFEEME